MQKTLRSKGHEALVNLIIEKRKAAGMRQEDLAKALGVKQPWIAHLESGERRIDIIELFIIADAIGFNPIDELKAIHNMHNK